MNSQDTCAFGPVLEYACQVWDDAAESLKSKLDSVQHRVLASAVGVRRSTSSLALQVECAVPPLGLRRQFLTAVSYSRFLALGTPVGRLMRSHASGSIEKLDSDVWSSFAARGEKHVAEDSFPVVGTTTTWTSKNPSALGTPE